MVETDKMRSLSESQRDHIGEGQNELREIRERSV